MIYVDIKSDEGYSEFAKCIALVLQGETAGAYSVKALEPGRFIAFHGCAITHGHTSLPCLHGAETLARIAWDWLAQLRDSGPNYPGWRVVADASSLVRIEPYSFTAAKT